MDLTDLYG